LLLQDFLFGFRFIIRLGVVDEQPNDIKNATEPGYNENNVNGLEVKIHGVKVMYSGKSF
jgi:hypothetical protein